MRIPDGWYHLVRLVCASQKRLSGVLCQAEKGVMDVVVVVVAAAVVVVAVAVLVRVAVEMPLELGLVSDIG